MFLMLRSNRISDAVWRPQNSPVQLQRLSSNFPKEGFHGIGWELLGKGLCPINRLVQFLNGMGVVCRLQRQWRAVGLFLYAVNQIFRLSHKGKSAGLKTRMENFGSVCATSEKLFRTPPLPPQIVPIGVGPDQLPLLNDSTC
jgi:hypothetical protein